MVGNDSIYLTGMLWGLNELLYGQAVLSMEPWGQCPTLTGRACASHHQYHQSESRAFPRNLAVGEDPSCQVGEPQVWGSLPGGSWYIIYCPTPPSSWIIVELKKHLYPSWASLGADMVREFFRKLDLNSLAGRSTKTGKVWGRKAGRIRTKSWGCKYPSRVWGVRRLSFLSTRG